MGGWSYRHSRKHSNEHTHMHTHALTVIKWQPDVCRWCESEESKSWGNAQRQVVVEGGNTFQETVNRLDIME